MFVNLSTEVHRKGSRRNAQSIGLFCNCVPCEPCEPYKSKLLQEPLCLFLMGQYQRAVEPSDPAAKVLRCEGSQVHKVHNMQETPIPWAFSCEPSWGPKVHILSRCNGENGCTVWRWTTPPTIPVLRRHGGVYGCGVGVFTVTVTTPLVEHCQCKRHTF